MKRINLPGGTTHVSFGDSSRLIANALWPDTGPDDDRMAYGATCINLDSELSRAVDACLLSAKDPLTLGPHTFPVGDALRTALVTVDDLRAFAAERGIEVIVGAASAKSSEVDSKRRDFLALKNAPYKDLPALVTSTPKPSELCMLMEVSICIADQKGWQNSVRTSFLDRMMTAAAEGKLTLYDTETEVTRLPKFGANCPDEFTTPEAVNKWLLDDGGRLTWVLDAPELQTALAVAESASGSAEPKSKLQWWQTAYEIVELWQNIGAKLDSQKKRTSNTAIAKEIQKRINEIQRNKGLEQCSPNWDTIRGVMIGWKWKSIRELKVK